MFLALYVLIGGWWLASGSGLLDRSGKPIGADFVTFWAASRLVLDGTPASVWDVAAITEVERTVIGAAIPPYVFHYPPTFLLALAPLALLPYVAALAVWWSATTAAFVVAVRRIAPFPATAGLALAFPGFFQNIVQGQNGGFTAALLGGGLALVDERPYLGGALLGALSYKPHLAPVVAVALLAGRRWAALGAASGVAVGMIVVSVSAFGLEPWRAFADNVPLAVRILETEGVIQWFRMPTVQVGAMQLGVPVTWARGLQAVSTAGALGAVAWAWGPRRASRTTRAVLVSCAAVLATPFAFDYDLAVLGVPIAFVAASARAARAARWRPWELPLLVAAWAGPLWISAVAQASRVGLAPLLLVALAVSAVRRADEDR